ncbi:ATP-binding cassette domain-containing protein [Virgibacillus byunsanensis]|uniref:ATP-binding cassette domain-containing protein n=1 Tax=Virgibacillus byunsanensis TaxID=570945 RepID=A0ABW3LTA7_9BACI
MGLENKRKEHPFSLSRDERQRLAVATKLVSNPKLILLDEPTMVRMNKVCNLY